MVHEQDTPIGTQTPGGSTQRVELQPLLEALWIDLLIEVNPKYTGKKRQHRGEGQENQDGPDCYLVQTPTGQGPEGRANNNDEAEAQAITDIHSAQKISRLAIEVEAARGTAIMHFGEAPINGRTENSCRPASRTKLAEDAAPGRWTRRGQESMIVDRRTVGDQAWVNEEPLAIQ
jgi:hypothetical protein